MRGRGGLRTSSAPSQRQVTAAIEKKKAELANAIIAKARNMRVRKAKIIADIGGGGGMKKAIAKARKRVRITKNELGLLYGDAPNNIKGAAILKARARGRANAAQARVAKMNFTGTNADGKIPLPQPPAADAPADLGWKPVKLPSGGAPGSSGLVPDKFPGGVANNPAPGGRSPRINPKNLYELSGEAQREYSNLVGKLTPAMVQPFENLWGHMRSDPSLEDSLRKTFPGDDDFGIRHASMWMSAHGAIKKILEEAESGNTSGKSSSIN